MAFGLGVVSYLQRGSRRILRVPRFGRLLLSGPLLFCVHARGLEVLIDFNSMEISNCSKWDQVRRLSISTDPTVPFHTCYKYYYEESNDIWVEYDADFVKKIEEGLRHNQETVQCSTFLFDYILYLKEMHQENLKTGTKRRMRKRPIFRSKEIMASELWTLSNFGGAPINPLQLVRHGLDQYPETWFITDLSLDYERIPLGCEDREFRHVYSYFHKTMNESKYIILEICRIQNYFQWEKYTRKRIYMARNMTETERNRAERHLFHGTDNSLVEAICKQNFDPRVCGKNGTVYGRGCYFAKEASYSHGYSVATSDGHYFMFLAKVLIGRPAVGNPLHRRPPPLNPDDPASPLYDSCASRMNHPDIFVLFDNDQFYPYFMIKYQKVEDQVILE
ncbi:protein mono-ADP-ribosyltransferase TIPARP-like [Rhinophrynus dorsalis]